MAEAAEAGQLELVLGLAAHNANLDAKHENGSTPMAEAALVMGLTAHNADWMPRTTMASLQWLRQLRQASWNK